jgi:hypothetical protein
MASPVTPLPRLMTEALVVGLGMIVLFFAVHIPTMMVYKASAMTSHALLAAQVAAAAALFHVLSEYTGLNAMYCAQRPRSSRDA